jgi:hypothetical protein
MIKMSVYYPADGGSKFDHGYYAPATSHRTKRAWFRSPKAVSALVMDRVDGLADHTY